MVLGSSWKPSLKSVIIIRKIIGNLRELNFPEDQILVQNSFVQTLLITIMALLLTRILLIKRIQFWKSRRKISVLLSNKGIGLLHQIEVVV